MGTLHKIVTGVLVTLYIFRISPFVVTTITIDTAHRDITGTVHKLKANKNKKSQIKL